METLRRREKKIVETSVDVLVVGKGVSPNLHIKVK